MLLHFIWSAHPAIARIHERSVVDAIQQVRAEVLRNNTAALLREFRRKYGLEAAGAEALALLLNQYLGKWKAHEDSGALLRVSIEQAYQNVRAALKELTVEVLHAPLGSEFIIADSPAFTFRHRPDGSMSLQVAIGDSNGIGLPISSRCFVAISPDPANLELVRDVVDRLNRAQIEVAEKQLYYRPKSEVRCLIEATLSSQEPPESGSSSVEAMSRSTRLRRIC